MPGADEPWMVETFVRRWWREALTFARDLGEVGSTADPHGLFDLGDTGGSDVAAEKHRYVGEAVEASR